MIEYEAIVAKIRTQLSEKRYIHSLGVSQTAVQLARRFGADLQKAALAGLLHDCARNFSEDRLLLHAEDHGLTIDLVERHTPVLLHAKVGSLLASSEYGVDDKEICRAIALHTTGGSKMTLLDKIIYLADFIEPMRSFPGVEELRKLAEEDLDSALLAAYTQSVVYILHNGGLLHPDTVTGRNELVMQNQQGQEGGGSIDG